MEQRARTGLEIKVRFFPMAFLFFFFPPKITIGDTQHTKYWGTHFFEIKPGRHAVGISIKYFFFFTIGESWIMVEVEEGKTVRLRYYMPPWIGAHPNITVSTDESL